MNVPSHLVFLCRHFLNDANSTQFDIAMTITKTLYVTNIVIIFFVLKLSIFIHFILSSRGDQIWKLGYFSLDFYRLEMVFIFVPCDYFDAFLNQMGFDNFTLIIQQLTMCVHTQTFQNTFAFCFVFCLFLCFTFFHVKQCNNCVKSEYTHQIKYVFFSHHKLFSLFIFNNFLSVFSFYM